MKLYEINQEIESIIEGYVNQETGEISDEANQKLDTLLSEKNQKILNTAKYIKNRSYFVEALKEEVKKLQARAKSEENKINWLEDYIKSYVAPGEKYEDSQCAVSLRKSSRVEVINLDKIPEDFKFTKTEIVPDKKLIAAAIKEGTKFEGALLVDNYSVQIK